MTETTSEARTILEVSGLDVGYYKDLNILQGLNIKARENQITAILGANGVGKSTALKAMFGFLRPNAGEILLEGESILEVPTYERILKGLAYIPQQPGVFKDMSVEENLQLGGGFPPARPLARPLARRIACPISMGHYQRSLA